MLIKQLVDEDFINYKKPSMFIGFPTCTFKCEKECGEHCCQNSALAQTTPIYVDINTIVHRYIKNPITHSIVCGGLEPFDSWDDLLQLIVALRNCTNDDIVIYTGYDENEVQSKLTVLKKFSNIIIKFGRFIPNQVSHYDDILGVNLSSNNQYAKDVGI